MAGYFIVGNGIYDGVHKAAAALENGVFVIIDASGTVAKVAAACDTIMQVEKKTTLWGLPAVVLRVMSVGEDEVFMTENEWDVNDSCCYDETAYSIAIGDYVKMKRPEIGDKMIISVGSSLYSSLSELDLVQPVATGVIAEYTPSTH